MTEHRPPTARVSRRAVLGAGATAALSLTAAGPAVARAARIADQNTPAPKGGASATGIIETRTAAPWVGPDAAPGLLGEAGLEPFSMIGASVPDLRDGSGAELRVLGGSGWREWRPIRPGHGANASDLSWVTDATGYQVRGVATGEVRVHLARDRSGLAARSGQELIAEGYRTAALNGPTPTIIPRSAWGARPAVTVDYWDTIRVGIVHHSVTSNAYGPADVPSILRSIQAYHMDVEGWWDIAYQFLVDRYGNIWEGREGGIDESFLGAHALGFNARTFAVCNLGDFTTAQPTAAMLNADAEVLAWKLKRYDIDAAGWTTVECTGDNEYFTAGQIVSFPAVIGHRDTRPTGCPGDPVYGWLPWLRAEARNRQPKYSVKPQDAAGSTGPLARNRDGRLEVFGIGVDGAVHHIWQDPGSPSYWSDLTRLGGSFPALPVSAISNEDGRLEVFMRGNDGKTYHVWQDPSSPSYWSGFETIGGLAGSPPFVGRNADGRLEVVAISDAGQLWHAAQVAPNTGWSSPQVLGESYAGSPALGATANGRLTLYAVRANGTLMYAVQGTPNGAFLPFTAIGENAAGRPAAAVNADGRPEVFVLGTDQRLWHSFQTGSAMSELQPLGGNTFSQPPAVGKNRDGRLEVFAVGADNHLWHIYQLAPNSGWSDWEQMGYSTYAGPPAVIANADGRLEVFVLASDQTIRHAWQVAPNRWWSDFLPLASGLSA